MISAILLAAGDARRFGAPKLLEELDGKPLVRWSAESVAGADEVGELVVVVGANADEIEKALAGIAARFVRNERATGMASSLAVGVDALRPDAEAALVVLADEPRAGGDAMRRVIERYRRGGASVVVPRYRGVRGHPVLFARAVFPELLALDGDRGARSVADRDPARLAFVDLDLSKPVDVDTPEDLARLRR